MKRAIIIVVFAVWLTFFWLPHRMKNNANQICADKLYHGQRNFSINLLHALQKIKPGETLFFSPHSIFQALLLRYFMAEGKLEESLMEILQLNWTSSKTDVVRAYKLEGAARTSHFENQTVQFDSIERLYFSHEYKLE